MENSKGHRDIESSKRRRDMDPDLTFSRQWKKRLSGREDSQDLYASPTPELKEPWYADAQQYLQHLLHLLKQPRMLENAMRVYVYQKTTPSGTFEPDAEFTDAVLFCANLCRTDDIPAFQIPPTPPDTPPDTPHGLDPVLQGSSPRDNSPSESYHGVRDTTEIDEPFHSNPDSHLNSPDLHTCDRHKVQLWLRISQIPSFAYDAHETSFLIRQSALLFTDAALKPGRDRSIADLFTYAHRLVERSIEDRRRAVVVALGFHDIATTFKPPEPEYDSLRMVRWYDADYESFFSRHGIHGDFAENKKLFHRQRKLGFRYSLLAELGEGVIFLLLPYMSENELLDAPLRGEARLRAMQHIRDLGVPTAPLVLAVNARIAKLKSYLKGEE